MGRAITQETQGTIEVLHALGARIRQARKALGLTAQDVADAAGISRVTLYRIEKGEPSVTIAAYANVMQMVGLPLTVPVDATAEAEPALPERIRIADFTELAKLAWQMKRSAELTPAETWNVYERNARLLDETKLSDAERRLLELLRREFEANSRV